MLITENRIDRSFLDRYTLGFAPDSMPPGIPAGHSYREYILGEGPDGTAERFVMTGAIALGLLQLISLKFEQSVWSDYAGFLRTKSRDLPSERTVKSVMEVLLSRDLISFAPGAVMRKIIQRCCNKKAVFEEAYSPPELEEAGI